MRATLIAPAVLAASLSACGLIYKQDIQQGNVLDQEQIDMLVPGMTRRQVSLVLGTPAISDPFHRQRWDYVSIYKEGGEKLDKRRQLTLFFEGNELARIEGDVKPTEADILGEEDIERVVEEVKDGEAPTSPVPRRDAPDPPDPAGDPTGPPGGPNG